MAAFAKYKWLTYVICLFCHELFFAHAPDKPPSFDSLNKVVEGNFHDTSKIKALLLMSQNCAKQDILKYAEPALRMSENNLKNSNGLPVLKKFYLEGTASALTSVGFYYMQYNNPSQALESMERALAIHTQLNDQHCTANSLVGMGNIQLSLKDGPLALEYYNRALVICERTKDSVILAPLLNNIGTVYSNAARLAPALEYMHQSLKLYRLMHDTMGIARQLGSISLVYQKQGDFIKAQEYNFDALQLAENNSVKDEFQVARVLHNIGHVYVSAKEFEKAEPYFSRALTLSEKLGHKYGTAFCSIGLAKVYQSRGDLDKALQFFKRGLKLNEEIKDRLGICVGLQTICEFYLKTGNLSLALEYGKRSLAMAREINYPGKISACSKLLYQIYKQQQKPADALEMYELYITNRDSVNSDESRKVAMAKQMQYEFDKKETALKAEQEKRVLKIENERVALLAVNERKKLIFVIGLSLAGLIIALLFVILIKSRARKAKKEADFEKSVLMLEQQALRAQMNPHFIFNAINSIQNYILKREKQEAYDYLAKFSRLIRIVLNNSQEKDLLLHQELEMVQLYVELEQLRFNNFEFNLTVSERVNQFETVVPSMLIQPYVENAICHGLMNLENERKGVLDVIVSQQAGLLKISIEDNGIGRERSRQFKKADAHKSLGMAFTEQRLQVINKMRRYEEAKVQITDLYDKLGQSRGTRVEINIPVEDLVPESRS